jgi:hypothetical protein
MPTIAHSVALDQSLGQMEAACTPVLVPMAFDCLGPAVVTRHRIQNQAHAPGSCRLSLEPGDLPSLVSVALVIAIGMRVTGY